MKEKSFKTSILELKEPHGHTNPQCKHIVGKCNNLTPEPKENTIALRQ